MQRSFYIRTLTVLLGLTGFAAVGCTHTATSSSTPSNHQPGATQATRVLPSGSAPPPESAMLDEAKKRFGQQQQ